jgi:UDP-N-acetylglucosamine acyltransferase
MKLHPTAVVHPRAELAPDVEIGPYCILEEGVVLHEGVRLMGHVVLQGRLYIGPHTVVYPFASLGLPPQDLKYRGEDTAVHIGARNIIREYVTIHRASVGGEGSTIVGDDNFIMAYAHIAHDCRIGNHVVMANAATLGGHVVVQDHAVLGGLVAVHQFTRIGAYAMVGGFSGVGQDVPPFMVAAGPRATLHGLNLVGLRRQGFSEETIAVLKQAYRILFRSAHTLEEAIRRIKEELPPLGEVRQLVEFLQGTKRSICRPGRDTSG